MFDDITHDLFRLRDDLDRALDYAEIIERGNLADVRLDRVLHDVFADVATPHLLDHAALDARHHQHSLENYILRLADHLELIQKTAAHMQLSEFDSRRKGAEKPVLLKNDDDVAIFAQTAGEHDDHIATARHISGILQKMAGIDVVENDSKVVRARAARIPESQLTDKLRVMSLFIGNEESLLQSYNHLADNNLARLKNNIAHHVLLGRLAATDVADATADLRRQNIRDTHDKIQTLLQRIEARLGHLQKTEPARYAEAFDQANITIGSIIAVDDHLIPEMAGKIDPKFRSKLYRIDGRERTDDHKWTTQYKVTAVTSRSVITKTFTVQATEVASDGTPVDGALTAYIRVVRPERLLTPEQRNVPKIA